jgi:hypothetical protein
MQKKPPFPLSNTLRIINQIQLAEAIYELSNLEKNVLSNPERIYDLFHANTLLDEIKETDQAFAHYLRGQVKLSFAEELRDFPCWAKAGAVVSCTSKRALSPPPPLC